MYAAVSSYTGNPRACFGVWTQEHPCPTAWQSAASTGSSISLAMACTSSIALLAAGISTSPMDHEVQTDTAAEGLGSSGWDASRSAATLAAFSNAQMTTVRLSAAFRSSESRRRHGLSLVNSMEHPRERRPSASVMSMDGPTPLLHNIWKGPEPLDLRTFRCS